MNEIKQRLNSKTPSNYQNQTESIFPIKNIQNIKNHFWQLSGQDMRNLSQDYQDQLIELLEMLSMKIEYLK